MAINGEDRLMSAVRDLSHKVDLHDGRMLATTEALRGAVERQERAFERFEETVTDMGVNINLLVSEMRETAKNTPPLWKVILMLCGAVVLAALGKDGLELLKHWGPVK